ncbi:MAG: PhoH family protein [Clostridia bacterium]|nr:PhoH family protein [Clostridia bacterium]
MAEKIVFTESAEETAAIFGSLDYNLRFLEKAFDVRISDRGRWAQGCAIAVKAESEEQVEKAVKALEHLRARAARGEEISEQKLIYVTTTLQRGEEEELSMVHAGADCLCITVKGKPIKAKTAGQKIYADRIRKNTVVLGIGPAGTGKTFLAVAMAVSALRAGQVSRLILTRPAVEAGEKLGYLPGDLQNKIDPYLRPLYDALFEMLGPENYQKQMEKGTIEIAPLAYMRGRTLDDSFIILDEAQNTTPEQMKMFLTRLGNNSKAVITGDITQTDLPRGQKSGLVEAVKVLEGIEDIAIHRFTDKDVVRHKLVQQIILAYEQYAKKQIKEEQKRYSMKRKPKD